MSWRSLHSSRRNTVPVLIASLACLGVCSLLSPGSAAAQIKSSEAAFEAQKLASDPALPGPEQPIPFSHALHAGTYKIECLYCHTGTDRSRMAGVPSVQTCMGCHAQFGGDLEGVQTLKKFWDEKKPIEWIQIHRLPEHVKFRHNRHVAAGLDCQTCHGPVQQMHKVHLVPDRVWVNGMPAQKLEMGWCIQCHEAKKASIDCLTCHY
ncbi:MAG: cytochrome c3 family protein [Deltaproteobacteria bacterium]|nr:cytochrome c3 family protein [Deltaproteobacteria bacterium]